MERQNLRKKEWRKEKKHRSKAIKLLGTYLYKKFSLTLGRRCISKFKKQTEHQIDRTRKGKSLAQIIRTLIIQNKEIIFKSAREKD